MLERPKRLYGSMDEAFVLIDQEWKETKLISWYPAAKRNGQDDWHVSKLPSESWELDDARHNKILRRHGNWPDRWFADPNIEDQQDHARSSLDRTDWQMRADQHGFKAFSLTHSCPGMPANGYDPAVVADCAEAVV